MNDQDLATRITAVTAMLEKRIGMTNPGHANRELVGYRDVFNACRTRINDLEAGIGDHLSARDLVALQLLPNMMLKWHGAGECVTKAFKMADLFLEARKEVSPPQPPSAQ